MRKRNAQIIVSLVVGLIVHQCPMSYGQLDVAWSFFEKFQTLEDAYLKYTTPSTADLMDVAMEQSEKIDEIGDTLGKMEQAFDLLLSRLPLAGSIDGDVRVLTLAIGRIDALYDRFESYIDRPQRYDEEAVTKLIEEFTEFTGDSVLGKIDDIYSLIVGRRMKKFKKTLFYNLAKEAQHDTLGLCDTGGSPQKRLLDLFNVIVETETRGSLMTAFGWTMKAYLKKNDSAFINLRTAQEEVKKRGEGYLKVLKEGLKIAPTQFRQCDPESGHRIGVTALEFQKFLQGYITQESTLDLRHECKNSCERHSFPTDVYWMKCTIWGCDTVHCIGYGCGEHPRLCRGDLIQCETMSSELKICQYDDWKSRRYAWLKDGEGDNYGNVAEGCDTGEIVHAKRITDTGSGYSYTPCALCKCICADWTSGSTSTRFISTRPQVANVNDNMVIIGLQFVMKNNIAHIRVMQGQLGPKGVIDEESVSWIEPENLQVRPSGGSIKFYKVNEGESDEEIRWNTDVSPMDPDFRRLLLDRLMLPKDYVLTGVKFGRHLNGYNDPIQLEIQGTRFDYDTGKLTPDDSMWMKPNHNNNPGRYAIKKAVFGNPTGATSSKIDTQPNTYIDMYTSDWLDDAAQTTLPLLDAIPVHGTPHMPIVGVGLYHKRQEGYGGLLTFVLDEINRASFLTTYEEIKG